MGFPRAEPASPRCSGRAQPGAAALMAWCVSESGAKGARNWGIYNCRSIRGSWNRSIHGDGRAVDVGFSGSGNPEGWRLVRMLLPHVGKLGIQRVIWARTIWDAKRPNGARYTGSASHMDHVHVELTWAAARGLSLATIRAAMRGQTVAPAPAAKPITQPSSQPHSQLQVESESGEEDEVAYYRAKPSGAVFRVGASTFEHLDRPTWAAEEFLRGAKAVEVSDADFMRFVASLGLIDAKGLRP